MTKLISKETRNEVLRLRFEENLSFSEVAKRAGVGRSKAAEICREEEAKRKRGAEEEVHEHEKSQTAQELEAEAFKFFEENKTPLDLVTDGFTTAEIAENLWNKFVRLKTISDHPPGYEDGYTKGFEEAKKKYSVEIPCTVCRKPILITAKDSELKEDLEFLIHNVVDGGFEFIGSGEREKKWTWSHLHCINKPA